jgi:hypothetical protein
MVCRCWCHAPYLLLLGAVTPAVAKGTDPAASTRTDATRALNLLARIVIARNAVLRVRPSAAGRADDHHNAIYATPQRLPTQSYDDTSSRCRALCQPSRRTVLQRKG